MVIVANLEGTGKKCVTAERDGGVVLFSADGKSIELNIDEANLLLDFLIQKRELEAAHD